MTTIIATRQAIWADTLCAYTVPFHFSKIVRIGDSIFAGAAADMLQISKFLEWKRGGERPEYPPDADFDAVEVNKEGIWLYDQGLYPIRLKDKVYIIGTGAEYAIGALAMGATPEQALRIAARHDKNTGLPIETMSL